MRIRWIAAVIAAGALVATVGAGVAPAATAIEYGLAATTASHIHQ